MTNNNFSVRNPVSPSGNASLDRGLCDRTLKGGEKNAEGVFANDYFAKYYCCLIALGDVSTAVK